MTSKNGLYPPTLPVKTRKLNIINKDLHKSMNDILLITPKDIAQKTISDYAHDNLNYGVGITFRDFLSENISLGEDI